MIYDVVNAIVYVILAQLFCSAFLDREERSIIFVFVVTILWILASLGVGTFFEGTLVCRIVIVVIINIVFAVFLYKKKNKVMILVIPTLFYILAIACDFFVAAIHRYFDPNLRIAQIMESDISVYMGAASQFIQLIIVFILRKLFIKTKTTIIDTKLWLIYLVFPLYSLSLIALLIYSFDGPVNITQANFITYMAASLLVINLFIFWFIKQESQRVLEAQRNEMEIIHAKGIVQLYEQITNERDILGKREHEFKNTITVLKSLIAEKQYEQMKEILNVQNTELVNNTNVFETGNRLINTILNTKYAEAREKGITFRFVLKDLSSLKMEDRDCIVIFTNILNNAIEAAEQCPEDNRFLSIKTVIEEGQLIFACRNSYKNNDTEMKSKKRDVVPHGYGLVNIKEAVNRNRGNCFFEKEEKEFVSVVIIPLQGTQPD
ncbi:MAG: GHKL domain-containing protein [Saccharofermentans sp.]|nr:GHKL domain-containing protein [Saccharofermentans sp.]